MDLRNKDVTLFLDQQVLPSRPEIEKLRYILLNSGIELSENIKWNGPNYHVKNEDRITMRIQPPKQVQLIFHCGAKVKEQPKNKLVEDHSDLLIWKGNDRAVATFKTMKNIENYKSQLTRIIKDWIIASC